MSPAWVVLAAAAEVQVRVEDVAAGVVPRVTLADSGGVPLVDQDPGQWSGRVTGDHARFERVRVEVAGVAPWDGLVATPDGRGVELAFRVDSTRVVRVPPPVTLGRVRLDTPTVPAAWFTAALLGVGLLFLRGLPR